MLSPLHSLSLYEQCDQMLEYKVAQTFPKVAQTVETQVFKLKSD